jgi:hypothetical protein
MAIVTANAQAAAMANNPVPFPFVSFNNILATTPFPRYNRVAVPASSPMKMDDISLGSDFWFSKTIKSSQ